MNLLTEVAPRSIKIEGQLYEIDADFRNCIKFEQLMFDPDVPDNARGGLALNLFYPVIPQNITEAFQKVLWFYAAEQNEKKQHGASRQKRIYSFEADADYIFAAFLGDYGIDLNDINFLHWWKFRALFFGLKPDNLICKIMEYRATDISKMKGEERKFYQKMQREFALPVPREEQDKYDEIADALMKGGDISSLMSNP